MVNFFSKLKKFFLIDSKELEYRYLCEAVDRVDLERRMREIDLGKAPFQH